MLRILTEQHKLKMTLAEATNLTCATMTFPVGQGPRALTDDRMIVGLPLLFAAVGLQLLSFVFLARGLGPAEYGKLSVILAFALPMAELTGLGTSERFLQVASRRPRLFSYMLANSLATIAMTGPIIAIVAVFFCSLAVPDESVLTIFLLVISETLAGRFLINIEFAFLAKGASFLINLQRLVVAGMRCGIAGLFFFTLHDWDLRTWSYAYSATLFFLVFVFLIVQIIIYGQPRLHPKAAGFLFGTSFALVNFSFSVSQAIDKVALSFTLSFDEIGLYNAGSRALYIAQIPAGLILRDNYSRFFQAGLFGFEAAYSYAQSILAKVFGVAVASSAFAATVAFLLPFLLGRGYQDSARVGAIISLAAIARALQSVASDILNGAGEQAMRAAVGVASIPLTAIAILFGAWRYELVGAAVAFVAAQAVMAGLLWLMVAVQRRRHQLRARFG